jgi:beta-galactosidase
MKQLFLLSLLFLSLFAFPQRKIILLDTGWKFMKADPSDAASPHFNDAQWQRVTVPHDWAIKGPFDKMIDAQTVTVTEDGEKKPALRTGRTGGLPWTGVGWYRKQLNIPAAAKGKRVSIEFDGAMSHAVVYLNGDSVGTWPYGYASFSFDLTDKINPGGKNILAVRLENPEESSRWYPGAGIYRHVRLVFTENIHVKQWGHYILTPVVQSDGAVVNVNTSILNHDRKDEAIQIATTIFDPAGKKLQTVTEAVNVGNEKLVTQKFSVRKPLLWDIHSPRLYKAVTKIYSAGKLLDVYETAFGIRSFRFDANDGFILNNRQVKIKGVCNHHDLGPLGAAVNYGAIERQLQQLKAMGCNAIRTSHNPPAPELLDLCDKMGFLVMDEAFDEWKLPKTRNGYNRLFEKWAEKDLRAMIKRDRNHPSVILWSIGNEVPEQKDKDGAITARFLTDIAHNEDPTRPVTSGFNSMNDAIKNGLTEVVDVVGINYRTHRYTEFHQKYPHWKIIGSETESAVSTRGVYMFPVVERKSYKYPNNHSSSYDLEAPSWGNAPDIEFALQEDHSFVAGSFVWTGHDYLGEPTPYSNNWPSHSSYFGIIDLAGIPKDRYYLYQSEWSASKVLHVLPHWTWPGREGEITPVHVYTSNSSAELFVNGKSMGIQKKDSSKYGRFRLRWDSVIYEPGEIKIIAADEKGKREESIVRTAGPAFALKLIPERKTFVADGQDLVFIRVAVVDRSGNVCPAADNNIQFTVSGAGQLKGLANGDPTNLQSLQGNEMNAFSGYCTLVVQSNGKKGSVQILANAPGLKPAVLSIPATVK